MDWAKGLDFEVPVVGEDLESMDSVDWLFWIGCAGAYEDRAKKTVRAVAELLHLADVSFGVLGNGETCTGDPARRAGNEFVYQGLAAQNVETLTEHRVKQVVTTCPHCLNTLKNEYRDLGLELDVVHHTQLLNRLVREGRLTPVTDGAGAATRSITYHDPCYLGRHNQVYAPPRELLQVLPGASYVEMERSAERSFCCGAGGARMWMEENLGERINVNRTQEAVATGADQIAVGCPFCRVMLSDGLTSEQADGRAREEVEVLDVAQMLLASVKGESATRAPSPVGLPSSSSVEPGETRSEETRAEPEPGDDTQTTDTVTETVDVGPAAAASGGSSLFDLEPDEAAEPEPEAEEAPAPKAAGGSLFDLEPDEAAEPQPSSVEPQPCVGRACRDHRAQRPDPRGRLAVRPRARPGGRARARVRRGGVGERRRPPVARCSTSSPTGRPSPSPRRSSPSPRRSSLSRPRSPAPRSPRAARCSTSPRPSRTRTAADPGHRPTTMRRHRRRSPSPGRSPRRGRSGRSRPRSPASDVDIDESGSLFDL